MSGKRLGALVLISMVGLLSACQAVVPGESTGKCRAYVRRLLIDVETLPEGWSAGQPEENDVHSGGAREHCLLPFEVSNGEAFEEIYEYGSEDEATSGYERLLAIFSYKGPLTFPAPEIATPAADEAHLACATMAVGTSMCQFLARYGVYVVHFNAHVGPEIMTDAGFERAVQAIDGKMARRSN